jgi:hypothetical protein
MTGIRRVLVLIGLTLAVMIGAAIPASATFADSVTAKTSITTGIVAAPTGVTVNDSCITTTTTTKRTVRTDPVTGVQTVTANSTTTGTNTSASNVQGTTTTTAAGPGAYETTTTTVTKNTNLHVTVSWVASQSRGVNGYVVSAHLGAYNQVAPLMATTATTVTAVEDADQLALQPSVIVTTSTTYGWTADAARTAVLAC